MFWTDYEAAISKSNTDFIMNTDDWTNLRTIDESKVNSSWEIVVWTYKSRKGLYKEDIREQGPQEL